MIYNRGPRGRPTGGPKRKKPDTRASVVPVSTPRSTPKRVRSGDSTNPVTPRMAAQRKKLRETYEKDLFDAASSRAMAAQRKKLSNAASSKAMGEYNAVTRSAAPPKSVRSEPVTRAQMAAQRKQMNAAGSMAADKFNANVKKGIRNAKPVQATKVSSAQMKAMKAQRGRNAAAEERGVSPSAKVRQNPSPRLQTPKAGRGVVPPAKVRQNPSPRQQINFTPVPKAGQGQTLREQTIRQAASKRKAPTKPNTAGRGPSNRGNTGK